MSAQTWNPIRNEERTSRGVARNSSEAARYYRCSAIQGNANGQFRYATCHHYGISVAIDFLEATTYYKLPVDQGHAEGQLG
jgi:TPR repeat protein